MVIKTEFDGLLEEDVIFEETEQTLEYKDILKNSENLMKSFLYMKKIFSSSPSFNNVISFETFDFLDRTLISISSETNVIMVKNIKDSNSSIFLNGGEFVLLPFESFEFPVVITDEIELIGRTSVIQTKFTIG